MPYIDLPERGLKVYYVINAARLEELAFSTVQDAESEPLDPSKPNLLFLHSGTLNTSSYSKQFQDQRLRSTFNLIAIDSRFHGRTTGKEIEFSSLQDCADDIIATIDKLSLGSFAIAAEGVKGCQQAIWIRIKRPNQVRSLMLISPGPLEESEELKASLHGIAAWFGTNKDGSGDGTGNVPVDCLAAGAEYFFGQQERLQQRKKEWTDHAIRRYGAGHTNHDILHICNNAAVRKVIPDELLASITCPVLILQGAQDFVVSPIEGAREWQKKLFNAAGGGCDLRVISDGPHLLAYSDFNIVNRMILAFCRGSS